MQRNGVCLLQVSGNKEMLDWKWFLYQILIVQISFKKQIPKSTFPYYFLVIWEMRFLMERYVRNGDAGLQALIVLLWTNL